MQWIGSTNKELQMANVSVTQSYYNIVDGKFEWHFEPAEFEILRGKIQSAEVMYRYWSEAKRHDKMIEVHNEYQDLFDEYQKTVEKWRKCQE